MPATTSDEAPQVVKWFTRARKFPQLVGKTHDGKAIWGGPYTFTQVFAVVGILLLASRTTTVWAHFGFVGNILTAAGVAYATAWALGRLPVGARNPVWVVLGTLRSVNSPTTGRLAGKPIRIAKPHRVRSRLSITEPALRPAPALPVAQVSSPQPAPAVPTGSGPSPSVVQRLLATQTSPHES